MIDPDDDIVDSVLESLLEKGYVEIIGFDEKSQQNTYRITEKGREFYPELYEESMAALNSITFNLWQKDMINLFFDENGNAQISLNKNSYDEEKISQLAEDEKFTIIQFRQIINPDNGII
jgi:DNA-binding PadR family transcriptional regulator